MSTRFDLSGKVALVTGGNSGLGLATAKRLSTTADVDPTSSPDQESGRSSGRRAVSKGRTGGDPNRAFEAENTIVEGGPRDHFGGVIREMVIPPMVRKGFAPKRIKEARSWSGRTDRRSVRGVMDLLGAVAQRRSRNRRSFQPLRTRYDHRGS